jgi:hypothetical protein
MTALLLLVALGCGGAPASPGGEGEASTVSAGGEASVEPEAEGPRTTVVMRTTIPIALPQPATPREQLPAALQRLWARVERTISARPPEPPADATLDGVTAWAEGPFKTWSELRLHAIEECKADNEQLEDAGPAERSIAAALFGYLHEDTAARIRGAPVPVELAEDAELLATYVDTLEALTRPIAEQAAGSYSYCAVTLNEVGDRAWNEWMQYCAARAVDIAQVFELPLGGQSAPDPGASGAEPTE